MEDSILLWGTIHNEAVADNSHCGILHDEDIHNLHDDLWVSVWEVEYHGFHVTDHNGWLVVYCTVLDCKNLGEDNLISEVSGVQVGIWTKDNS